jgi:hypothetical protein
LPIRQLADTGPYQLRFKNEELRMKVLLISFSAAKIG